jgi:hypothetical protein
MYQPPLLVGLVMEPLSTSMTAIPGGWKRMVTIAPMLVAACAGSGTSSSK